VRSACCANDNYYASHACAGLHQTDITLHSPLFHNPQAVMEKAKQKSIDVIVVASLMDGSRDSPWDFVGWLLTMVVDKQNTTLPPPSKLSDMHEAAAAGIAFPEFKARRQW